MGKRTRERWIERKWVHFTTAFKSKEKNQADDLSWSPTFFFSQADTSLKRIKTNDSIGLRLLLSVWGKQDLNNARVSLVRLVNSYVTPPSRVCVCHSRYLPLSLTHILRC